MRKAIFAGGILAALIVVVVYATRVDAQDRNRLNFQGSFLPLVGPGSSIGVTVRDSDLGVVIQDVRSGQPRLSRGGERR